MGSCSRQLAISTCWFACFEEAFSSSWKWWSFTSSRWRVLISGVYIWQHCWDPTWCQGWAWRLPWSRNQCQRPPPSPEHSVLGGHWSAAKDSKGRQNVKFSWIWIALLPPEKRSFCPQELWKSFGNNTEHSPHSRSQHLLHASGGLLVDYFLGINDCLDCFSTQGWLPDSGLACRVCFFADSGSFAACPMQHMRSAPLPGQITGPSFACQTRTAKTFLASPPGPIPRQTWILPTEIWLQARWWMWQSYLHHPGRDGPGKSGTATIFLDVFQRLSWASAAKAACFLDSGPWLFLALDDYAPRHHEG